MKEDELEEFEIVKVGRQFYTVRKPGFPHAYYDEQIVIETFSRRGV
jgi:hypothetical protein